MRPIWFFVIFAPGMAGNHLANIISTDAKFISRVSDNFYLNLDKNNAHPPGGKIVEAVDRNQILCFHLSEFIWNQHVYLNADADIKFLVVEFPPATRTKLLIDRIQKLYPYYQNQFLLEELSTMYSVDSVRALLKCDDITPLPADLIFNPNSTQLVEYLQTQYELKFDPDKVQKMQSAWINMITTP
jgi:hypothetical protein